MRLSVYPRRALVRGSPAVRKARLSSSMAEVEYSFRVLAFNAAPPGLDHAAELDDQSQRGNGARAEPEGMFQEHGLAPLMRASTIYLKAIQMRSASRF